MPIDVFVDAKVPEAKRAEIAKLVEARLSSLTGGDSTFATVVRLPNGRFVVFVEDVADPIVIRDLEDAIRRLP